MHQVEIKVYASDGEHAIQCSVPIELGRQRHSDTTLYEPQELGDRCRVAVAAISCLGVPRECLRIEGNASDGTTFRIVNIHKRSRFLAGDQEESVRPGESFDAGQSTMIVLPEGIRIGIRVLPESLDSKAREVFRTLQAPSGGNLTDDSRPNLNQLLREGPREDQGRAAVDLVRQALDVVQKAAGSDEYFNAAARSVATMIELDRAFVILRSGNDWRTRAKYSADSEAAELFTDSGIQQEIPAGSQQLLHRILSHKRTIIFEPNNYMHTQGSSMMALDRAVAAPMLHNGEVIGVLYGDRRFGSNRADVAIGELEATLLEVMASGVASGLARQREESLRASMTQFFSPSVTERLEDNDDLLRGRDAEVTVLFCDIRGFSGITERVGPTRTIEWINDVLTELSQCVLRTDGVLVDYVGDELMAMWGAPAEQSDHAIRACLAAAEMLRFVEPLRERHSDITPDHFGFGIGINSGIARVGNTGSRVKFKYGPLGNTVNVASRVQGMTKHFGVPALITATTQQMLTKDDRGIRLHHRRLADVLPLGVQEVATIFQLEPDANEPWHVMKDRYENALTAYQRNDLTNAAQELAALVHQYPDDSPSVVLLGRVVDALTANSESVDTVFRFEHK